MDLLRGARPLVAAALVLSASPVFANDPGLTDTTIKIGMFGPLTGRSSLFGYPINNGAIAVYNEVNARGGIHGRKIEIVHEDYACAPDRAVAAVKKLMHRDNVFILHGGNCSGPVLAVKDDIVANKVPLMVMAAASPKLVEPVSKYVYTTAQDGPSQAATMLGYILSMPDPKKIGVVYHPDEWGNERADPMLAKLKQLGITPAAVETMDRNMTDATAQVRRLQRADATVVALLLYPAEAAIFLRDAQRYGYMPISFGTGGTMDLHDLATRAGGYDVIRRYGAVAYLAAPVEAAEMKPAGDLYTKYFPNDRPLALTFLGIGSARVVVEGLERAGRDLSREKFMAAMESIREFRTGVNSCAVSFTPESHSGCRVGTIWSTKGKEIVVLGPTWKPEHFKD